MGRFVERKPQNSKSPLKEHYQVSKSLLIQYIHNSILKRDGCIIGSVNGMIGSGKSYAGLRMCEMVDPFFNIDRVTFSIRDFAKLMMQDYPKGSAFLIEEAQVSAGNLEFWSKGNKGLYKLLSTLRHRNYFTLFTLPNNTKLDSSVSSLFQLHIKATGVINEKKGLSLCTFHFPKEHPFKKGTVYWKPIVTRDHLGKKVKCKSSQIYAPSNTLLKLYDIKKRAFTKANTSQIASSLEKSLS